MKNENYKCFECGKETKKEDLVDYLCLEKLVGICPECRKKFSDFAAKQVKANKKYTNWYDAKYQKSLVSKVPKKKIRLPIIKKMYWIIDTVTGEYILDGNGNAELVINMKNGRIFRGSYIGDWK